MTNSRKGRNRSNDSKNKPFKGKSSRTNRGAKTGGKPKTGRYQDFKDKVKKGDPLPSFNDDAIRLNKYLSNAGICSRREADVLIKTGVVSVNGVQITEMGYKVKPGDVVKYDGGSVKAETKRYVLLNKPKGFITTMDDPQGRKNGDESSA